LTCSKCGEPLQPGDMVVSKRYRQSKKRKAKTKFYHEECWENMFIDL